MKSKKLRIFSIICILTLLPLPVSAADAAVTGDLDADGICGRADIDLLRQYLLTAGTLKNGKAADLDGNGCITAADLSLLKRALLK